MKQVFLLIIKSYWVLIPKSKRRKCLFKTSCSNYVYDKTKKEGFLKGLKALKFRIKNCNPNYNIINVNNESLLITPTNKVFKEQEISKTILN